MEGCFPCDASRSLWLEYIQTVQDVRCLLLYTGRHCDMAKKKSRRISHFQQASQVNDKWNDALMQCLLSWSHRSKDKRKRCPLTWTPVSPVWTGCLSWESAACAQGESEDARGRETEKKTEGGREETFYPRCLTTPPPAPKANLPTATPRSSPWQ